MIQEGRQVNGNPVAVPEETELFIDGSLGVGTDQPPLVRPGEHAQWCTDIEKFFRLLYRRGDVWEVRAFSCPIFPGATKRKTASGYFNHPGVAARQAKHIDATRQPPGVYSTLNPVQHDLIARSKNRIEDEAKNTVTDDQIVCRRWLLLDIDPVRPAGVSATTAETKAAVSLAKQIREELSDEGWPQPLRGISGGGAYLLYRIDLPNDDAATDLVKRVLHGLANWFDRPAAKIDRNCFNASRSLRIFGTLNRKGDSTDERPHRVAMFLLPSGELKLVSREQLEAVAASPAEMRAAASQVKRQPTQTSNTRSARYGIGQQSAIERCRKYVEKMPPAVSGQGGHGQTLAAACECFRFGLDDHDAARVLGEYNLRCDPPWSDRDLDHKLSDARQKVEAAGEFGMRSQAAEPSIRSRPTTASESSSQQSAAVAELDGDYPLENPQNRTDTANGRRFVARHGERVRWCEPWKKWLIWDGRRWLIDSQREAEALAKEVADVIWEELSSAMYGASASEAGAFLKFATATASARGIDHMLAMARSEPGVPVLPESLDTHAWLINLQNCTLDLKTGQRREHRKSDLLTKIAPVVFDPTARSQRWEDFVAEIMGGDTDLIGFLQRLAGYWLTGSVRDHILPIFYGSGGNGKSVYLATMEAMLGSSYAMHAPRDLLMMKRHESHPTERADLFGKRLVCCVEAQAGSHFDESLTKELTGGDRIRARRMREDHWEFEASHKLVLSANYRPVVRGTDNGIWRRIRLVPFTVTIPPEHQDLKLAESLRLELSGIFNWCLQGCMDWQQHGLMEPASVLAATQDYRESCDTLKDFFDECCLIEQQLKVSPGRLYAAYEAWCKANGHAPDNNTVFGRKLTERGFLPDKIGGTRYRLGITLLAVPNQDQTF